MEAHLDSVLAEKGRAVYTIPASATVLEAVAEMNLTGVGALLVRENGSRIVGIFTERDVLKRVTAVCLDPVTTSVRSVMTPDVIAVPPSTTVGEAMALMTARRVRHLPVVDGDDLRGLVSIGDLTRWVVQRQQHEIGHLVAYITGRE